jgi:hypothetical protein
LGSGALWDIFQGRVFTALARISQMQHKGAKERVASLYI